MVKQVRNTEEIVRLAKQKSRRTRENVDKVISKLSLEGKTINFNTVAKEANVSKSWLYKEHDIRQRIEFLRKQQKTENVISKPWNGNSFFDKFYKVQNFFPYAIPIVLDNEPPRM